MIHGENFRVLSHDGIYRKVGFLTTRFIDACDEREAASKALKNILKEDKVTCMLNTPDNPHKVSVEEITEVGLLCRRFRPARGFTFYLAETDGW